MRGGGIIMLECVFWCVAVLAAYSYFIYPAILWLLNSINGSESSSLDEKEHLDSMSLIITVHNESKRIREKIENSLLLDSSALKEIIIASDHSDDGTDEIVLEYADRGVRLVRADQRLGKEYAQLCAIKESNNDIVVFSDVATRIPEDALTKMQMYFSNPDVGAVSSEDRFVSRDGAIAGEGAYVRYEMWLRKMESNLSGLVGLSGSFFAARKDVCQEWDIESPSDFNTALNCASLGMRAVTAPDVLGYYKDLSDSSKEYQRKVRTALRGMVALLRHPEVLNPLNFGGFAFQVWSHKVMRWAVPWLLIFLFLGNFFLLPNNAIYYMTLFGQLLFYGIALTAHFYSPLKDFAAAKIIYFFVQVNIALAESFISLLIGKKMTVWKPSAR